MSQYVDNKKKNLHLTDIYSIKYIFAQIFKIRLKGFKNIFENVTARVYFN